MKKGELWLVQLDQTRSVGHEYYNDRPAIVIMADSISASASIITIMPLSSSEKVQKDDIIIGKSKANGLYRDSVIRVKYIMSYDKSRFIHKIGEADSGTMERIGKYLRLHFGLDKP
jgi:mRNA-degrading endonuclease toxin of MazEF toxin-antitoxin module